MRISTLIVLWLIPIIAHANPKFDIALKGGPNSATQAEEFRVNKYGFSGGLSGSLQWPLVERFTVGGQMELLYTPRGSETVFQGEHVGELREHYVDLAIAARPELRLGWVSVYLLLGGSLDLLMSASKDDAAGMGQDITSGLHRTDLALLGAAGIALHLSDRDPGPFHLGTIFLEARHDIGLLDVDTVNGGFKNRTSSLMLGLSFIGGRGQPLPTADPTRPGN